MPLLRELIAKNWWVMLLRGLAAIAFGIMTFAWPGVTLVSLIILWGIWALIDGVIALMGGASDKYWASLLIGLIGIGAGIAAFMNPGLTALVLLYCIAAWTIVKGVLEIATAISMRKVITGEWMLILAGVLSVVFGLLLIANPGAGALAVLWIIGSYAILFGLLLVALSFKVKGLGTRARSATA